MKHSRILSVLIALTIAVSLFAVPALAADAPVPTALPVTVNGFALKGATALVDYSGEYPGAYIPLRAVSESLGYKVDWIAATNTATLSDGDFKVELSLSNGVFTVSNGLYGNMGLFVLDGRTYVKTSFFEAVGLKSLVKTEYSYADDANFIAVYVDRAKSGIAALTFYYNVRVDDDDHAVTANLAVPQFSELKDKVFQTALNKEFSDRLDAAREETLAAHKEIEDFAASEGAAYSYSSDLGYTVTEDDGFLTLTLDGYVYSGGAHGLPLRDTYVISLAESKRYALKDLFKNGADYEKLLIAELNKLRAADSEKYEAVDKIDADNFKYLGGYGFYLTDDALVIYFQPYEVGPYAAGFVDFEVPLAALKDYLK
ncbi:MAG: DUF3298 domain-containing protein [Oscillospiraceae bacterium]|jgi:hypothetical protein|nr:DUF3298 domain-containing protein [Oscillospiraceae bacterium]